MENEQNNEKKNSPKDQARSLFFQSALTQAQIAELVGVSQKTISLWMNDGKWKLLKESAENAPAVIIEQMTNELAEMHHSIASREPGKRFATLQESEIRRKILISLRYMKDQQTTAVHTEVLMNFMDYMHMEHPEDARIIVKHADNYLVGEKKLGLNRPFQPYSLPGSINIPAPFGTAGNNEQPAPPPSENDKPTDLDKAA
jgi:hypothetical protein